MCLKDGVTDNLLVLAKENAINAYRSNDENEAFFADALYAVIKIAIQNSARELLPIYSGLSIDKWEAYFEDKNAVKNTLQYKNARQKQNSWRA